MKWLSDLTTSQWWAASRQYITFFAGILVALGLITATQSQDLLKGFADFIAGAKQMLAGLATIAGVIVAAINSYKAAHNAGTKPSLERIQESAAQNTDIKAALISATAQLPEVEEVKLDQAHPVSETLAAITPINVKIGEGK